MKGNTNAQNRVFMVPDYSQKGTTQNLNTTYTASSNGYLYITGFSNGNRKAVNVTINGAQFTVQFSNQNETNFYSSTMYPIAKGDTYRVTSDSGLEDYGGIFFLPARYIGGGA